MSGETLLVGGVDASGRILGSMEAVDATTSPPHSRTGGLAVLAEPRVGPVVMRLASGEILVAGGSLDTMGTPASTLEWFPPDAGPAVRAPAALVASKVRAFLPLDAGGALAVIVPDAPTPGFQNVWVISADGGLLPATPIEGALTDVRLFDGPEQEPILWTGDRWLVWQPWAGAFTALASAIGASGPTGDPVATTEPGLGAWLDGATGTVHALRFGTPRGPYATTPTSTPLLLSTTDSTAPDRLVLAGTVGPVTFDPTAGLSLQPGASVFVTDATFASFTFDAETPGAVPPAVVLRDTSGNETILDPSVCPFTPGTSLHLERDGGSVRASAGGGPLVTCTAAPASGARVSIGVRGAGTGTGTSVVRAVVVTRT